MGAGVNEGDTVLLPEYGGTEVKLDEKHICGGVAHSFTGTPEDHDKLLAFINLCIGINGCSLKTSENLDALKGIPVDRMMIETDSSYCEIKNTHAGKKFIKSSWPSKKKEKYDQDCLVKGRNEPCLVRKVIAVGPGTRDKSGNTIPVYVNEGDTVLLPEYGGTEVKLGEKQNVFFISSLYSLCGSRIFN
ncbi:hypothetical protein L6452_38039 [Arctium lappa]|uniref:Uncharacterized protein n=1 Tax=Arctium lappa TaxID=4217 RepID=A0ACB8Y596_ARCLA|nr:hypothetical protein L6452_38039 [Arctium lappa]